MAARIEHTNIGIIGNTDIDPHKYGMPLVGRSALVSFGGVLIGILVWRQLGMVPVFVPQSLDGSHG